MRFENYRGVLRGRAHSSAVAGTRSIGALLTSTLLFDAGYETEIRGATLTGEQVALLLAQVRPSVAAFDGHLNLADMGLPLDAASDGGCRAGWRASAQT